MMVHEPALLLREIFTDISTTRAQARSDADAAARRSAGLSRLLTLSCAFDPLPPPFATDACGFIVALLRLLQNDGSHIGLEMHMLIMPIFARLSQAARGVKYRDLRKDKYDVLTIHSGQLLYRGRAPLNGTASRKASALGGGGGAVPSGDGALITRPHGAHTLAYARNACATRRRTAPADSPVAVANIRYDLPEDMYPSQLSPGRTSSSVSPSFSEWKPLAAQAFALYTVRRTPYAPRQRQGG